MKDVLAGAWTVLSSAAVVFTVFYAVVNYGPTIMAGVCR
jgi:hypothetical protein